MHKFLDKIKSIESKPKIIKEFLNKKEIENFQKLYEKLPIEINNKRQKIIKKKWSETYFPDLQKLYIKKLETVINDFKMDNPKTLDGTNSLGLFQESFKPVSLHVDTGFNFDKVIYKQTLLPLSNEGETIIFKNRFYGCSTTFSIDPEELSVKGYNKRSSEHLMLYNQRPFDEKMYNKYLKHEDLNNLKGLEIEMVYKWRLEIYLSLIGQTSIVPRVILKIKKLALQLQL